jgi:hypothetical protein
MIAYTLIGVVGRFGVESGLGFGPCFAQDGRSIVEGALRDFAARLKNDKFFPRDQSKHRVGCGLGILNKVAVDGERAAVETCQFDHVLSVPPRSLIGGEIVVNRRHRRIAGEDRAKWNSSKVHGAKADEVGERGAFRMVNRISRAAATAI